MIQISIPSSVREIGEQIFRDCKSLKEIVIPEFLDEIPDYSFYRCTSLTKIELNEDGILEDTGKCAFSGCSSIEKILLLDSIEK